MHPAALKFQYGLRLDLATHGSSFAYGWLTKTVEPKRQWVIPLIGWPLHTHIPILFSSFFGR